MRVLTLFLLLSFQAADPKPCPLSTLRKEPWCGKCQRWKRREDLDYRKKQCKLCESKVERIEVCVREYYHCPTCNKRGFKSGRCVGFTCERKPMAKKSSFARTFHQCPGNCKRKGDSAQKCGLQSCSNRNGRFRKTCEYSGRFPHIKK